MTARQVALVLVPAWNWVNSSVRLPLRHIPGSFHDRRLEDGQRCFNIHSARREEGKETRFGRSG